MSFLAKKSGNSLPPVEAGIHRAVCFSVIDIGRQYSEKYEKSSHQLIIRFELPEQRMPVVDSSGKVKDTPRIVSKRYNLNLHEKSTLAKDIRSWRNKAFTSEEEEGFDLSQLLGKNCMLQIQHLQRDGRTYATVSTVMPLMKGMEKSTPENPLCYFCFADHGSEIPPDTPDWIVEKIKDSEEWSRLNPSG